MVAWVGQVNSTVAPPLRPRVAHLLVTVTGVDALQQHPLQVDLLADPDANVSSAPFPDALLSTGAYEADPQGWSH